MVAEEKHKLTDQVDCPWCRAKAGEPCYLQIPNGGMKRGVLGKGPIHLSRSVTFEEFDRLNPVEAD